MKKYYLIALISCALLLSCKFGIVYAQKDFWEPTNGPNGGNIRTIEISSDGTIYIGSMYGIYKSTNNGDTWLKIYHSIESIMDQSITTNVAGDIFLATFQSGIIRSTNQGKTWDSMNLGIPNLYINYIKCTSKGFLFTGVNSRGLYRSTNNGFTWLIANSGLPKDSIGLFIESLLEYNSTILLGTNRGLYRSTNDGESWIESDEGIIKNLSGIVDISTLAKNPSGTIIAGTWTKGIFRSSDEGLHWTQVNNTLMNIYSVASNVKNNFYLGYTNFKSQIYGSIDDGITWGPISYSMPYVNYNLSIGINSLNYIFVVTSIGVFRSTDNGSLWTFSNHGIIETYPALTINNNNHLFAITYGIFRSTDYGKAWVQSKMIFPNGGDGIISAPNGNLYTSSCEGCLVGEGNGIIYKSTDEGGTWIKNYEISYSEFGGGGGYINNFYVNTNGDIYALSHQGIFRSTNDGSTWKFIGAARTSSFVIDSHSHMFAGIEDGYIFKSTNQGQSWDTLLTGIPRRSFYQRVSAIAQHPNGNLFASTSAYDYVHDSGAVYRSIDDGMTWSQVNNGLPNKCINSLLINNSGKIFITTLSEGVFESDDNGENWVQVNSGLSNKNAGQLVISTDGVLFVALSNNGVFRSNNSTTAINNNEDKDIEDFILSQNYPNPFTTSTTIHYTIPKRDHVTLKIFDCLGREVTTLVDAEKETGEHTSIFDVRHSLFDIQSGLYFYRLTAGNYSQIRKMILMR